MRPTPKHWSPLSRTKTRIPRNRVQENPRIHVCAYSVTPHYNPDRTLGLSSAAACKQKGDEEAKVLLRTNGGGDKGSNSGSRGVTAFFCFTRTILCIIFLPCWLWPGFLFIITHTPQKTLGPTDKWGSHRCIRFCVLFFPFFIISPSKNLYYIPVFIVTRATVVSHMANRTESLGLFSLFLKK